MSWQPTITPQERRLFAALRLRKIECLANPVVCGYYPDLQIVGTNILIEIDGSVHRGRAARQKDRTRTWHLNQAGYRVLRFSNSKIDNELIWCVEKVVKAVESAKKGRTGLVFRAGKGLHPKQIKRARDKAKVLNRKPEKD